MEHVLMYAQRANMQILQLKAVKNVTHLANHVVMLAFVPHVLLQITLKVP